MPWAPSSDYDAEAARDNNNRSDLGTKEKASIKGWLEGASRQTTDIHDGKPWKRAVPWAPAENYGVGDPHPQPPHMRSEVDSVVYGRDIDGSGSGGEVPEWAVHVGAEETAAMGWSMKRSRSNIHREYKSEPAATSSLHKPVGQEQCKGRRMQQIVFGGETPGTEPRDPSCHYGKQGPDSQDGHGVPTSFKPPERTGGMAEVLRNPHLSAAYDTASATAHERGQSDILSAESNPFYRRHGKAVAFERHFAVPGSQARADAQPCPPPPPQAQAQAQPKPKPKPKPNPSPSPSFGCAQVVDVPVRLVKQKEHARKPHPELFRAGLTATQAAIEATRPRPDAEQLWRHQIVESDIQHFRNPQALTVKRRAHYDQVENAG